MRCCMCCGSASRAASRCRRARGRTRPAQSARAAAPCSSGICRSSAAPAPCAPGGAALLDMGAAVTPPALAAEAMPSVQSVASRLLPLAPRAPALPGPGLDAGATGPGAGGGAPAGASPLPTPPGGPLSPSLIASLQSFRGPAAACAAGAPGPSPAPPAAVGDAARAHAEAPAAAAAPAGDACPRSGAPPPGLAAGALPCGEANLAVRDTAQARPTAGAAAACSVPGSVHASQRASGGRRGRHAEHAPAGRAAAPAAGVAHGTEAAPVSCSPVDGPAGAACAVPVRAAPILGTNGV
jgi:hypothetical protein